MDINQDIDRQKTAIDLSQLPLQKHTAGNQPTPSQRAGSEISEPPPLGVSTVKLSQEGRAASVAFDFNATEHNLSKLKALGSSSTIAKAHASISYERVKNLLE